MNGDNEITIPLGRAIPKNPIQPRAELSSIHSSWFKYFMFAFQSEAGFFCSTWVCMLPSKNFKKQFSA